MLKGLNSQDDDEKVRYTAKADKLIEKFEDEKKKKEKEKQKEDEDPDFPATKIGDFRQWRLNVFESKLSLHSLSYFFLPCSTLFLYLYISVSLSLCSTLTLPPHSLSTPPYRPCLISLFHASQQSSSR